MIVDEIKAERARLVRGKVKNVLIIFLMLIIVGAPSFLYFKISTEEHIAFREAKNIKLATTMLAVEYYGNSALPRMRAISALFHTMLPSAVWWILPMNRDTPASHII